MNGADGKRKGIPAEIGHPVRPAPAPTPDLDAWLSRRSDRADLEREPFFEGRDGEFLLFGEAAMELDIHGPGGGSLVFQGAPGAGKTALVRELAEVVRLRSTREVPWVPVLLDEDDVVSAEQTASRILAAVAEEKHRLGDRSWTVGRIRRFGKRIWTRGGTVVGIGVNPEPSPKRVTVRQAFGDVAELIGAGRVVLFIDEAQGVESGEMPTRRLLRALHRGHTGVAVLPVYSGLGNTSDILVECGISRNSLGAVREVVPMSTDEARRVFLRVFKAYMGAVPEADRGIWAARLAEESMGWPQHIRGLQVAARNVLLGQGGGFGGDALDRVVAEGAKIRGEYYRRRVRAGVPRAGGVYRKLALAMSRNAANALSDAEMERVSDPDLRRLGVGFPEFLNRSLRAGLLARVPDADEYYGIPIPSLAEHLRNLPGTEPAPTGGGFEP